MGEWLVSIVVVIVSSFLLGEIIPDGKTSPVVRFVFAVCALLVIIRPLTHIKSIDLNSFFQSACEISEDVAFIDYTVDMRIDYYSQLAKQKLSDEGITLCDINFVLCVGNGEKCIKKIEIKKENLVIKDGYEHINIVTKAKKTLSALFNINEGDIFVYE